MENDITCRVELGFAGYRGAFEEFEVDARAGASEEDLLEIIHNDYYDYIYDLLSVESIEDNEDGSYDVTISFAGYIGVDEIYTVDADDADEAESCALDEAIWDFNIEYFEPIN
jgi:hypothetical protein